MDIFIENFSHDHTVRPIQERDNIQYQFDIEVFEKDVPEYYKKILEESTDKADISFFLKGILNLTNQTLDEKKYKGLLIKRFKELIEEKGSIAEAGRSSGIPPNLISPLLNEGIATDDTLLYMAYKLLPEFKKEYL